MMTRDRAIPVFSVAFALFYLTATYFNLALFTYHPATGELGFLAQPAKSAGAPAMYWYGWMTTAAIGAIVVAALATVVPERWDSWVQRALTFAFVFAVLHVIIHYLALFIADRGTASLEFLRYPATWAIGALAASAIASIFFPARWTQRLWPGWTGLIPLCVMFVFVFLLRGWFVPSVALILK